MSTQAGWASIAQMFSETAIPKVTEDGGLFGKKYIRLGPLIITVGGWMFQCGGTLGYGFRDYPVILTKLLGVPSDNANKFIQDYLQKLADDLLRQVTGQDKTLTDLFLYPTLAQSGHELTPGAKWMDTKVNDQEWTWKFIQITCQQGVAVSFHFPEIFQTCWINTFKQKPQEEWDEAYRLGVVSTPQQDSLILEDEVKNTLSGAVDWVREIVPTHFISSELSTLETLANS